MKYLKKFELCLFLFYLGTFILAGEARTMEAIVSGQEKITGEEQEGYPQHTPKPSTNIPEKPKIEKLDSVEESLSKAEKYLKRGLESKEHRYSNKLHQPNFRLSNEYFSQAYEISKQKRADVLLKYGWFKYKLPTDKAEGRKMIEEGLALSPNNPEALYMRAVCLYDEYYNKYSIHEEKKWKDGTPYTLTNTTYALYWR